MIPLQATTVPRCEKVIISKALLNSQLSTRLAFNPKLCLEVVVLNKILKVTLSSFLAERTNI